MFLTLMLFQDLMFKKGFNGLRAIVNGRALENYSWHCRKHKTKI